MRFLVAISILLNGLLAGLIAGHLMTARDVEPCRCRSRDEGPYPTGWVMPDPAPPAKPAGEAR